MIPHLVKDFYKFWWDQLSPCPFLGAYVCGNKVYPTSVYLFFIPEEGAEGDSWSLLSCCSALAESCLTGLGSQECEIKSTDES